MLWHLLAQGIEAEADGPAMAGAPKRSWVFQDKVAPPWLQLQQILFNPLNQLAQPGKDCKVEPSRNAQLYYSAKKTNDGGRMTKVLHDTSGNGLRFSAAAIRWLREREDRESRAIPVLNVIKICKDGSGELPSYPLSFRTDPDLIEMIEKMGPAATAPDCELGISEIDDNIGWTVLEVGVIEIVVPRGNR